MSTDRMPPCGFDVDAITAKVPIAALTRAMSACLVVFRGGPMGRNRVVG